MHIQELNTRELRQQHFVKPIQCSGQYRAVRGQQSLQLLTQVDQLQFYVWMEVFQCC